MHAPPLDAYQYLPHDHSASLLQSTCVVTGLKDFRAHGLDLRRGVYVSGPHATSHSKLNVSQFAPINPPACLLAFTEERFEKAS